MFEPHTRFDGAPQRELDTVFKSIYQTTQIQCSPTNRNLSQNQPNGSKTEGQIAILPQIREDFGQIQKDFGQIQEDFEQIQEDFGRSLPESAQSLPESAQSLPSSVARLQSGPHVGPKMQWKT